MVNNVQVLRCMAAYLVVFAHIAGMIFKRDQLSNDFVILGSAGVDLFFVISGFIMVYTTDKSRTSAGAFLLNRFVRVAPLYYIFTICIVALSALAPNAMNSTKPNALQLVQSLFFIPFEKSELRIYPAYFLGWTLNYEMFFYTLFAISIFISFKLRIFISALAIISLFIVYRFLDDGTLYKNVLFYFYSRPIMLDFVLGMLIGWYGSRLSKHLFICVGEVVVGAVFLVADSFLFPPSEGSYLPLTNTFLAFGIPAALIVSGAVGLESNGYALRGSLLNKLGDASYSIYLSHFLVVGIFGMIINKLDPSFFLRGSIAVLCAIVVGGAGYAVHATIEKPLTQVLKRLTLRRELKVSRP
jgi:peptidoglycan/LPS O-acetylase OafA/YrhL